MKYYSLIMIAVFITISACVTSGQQPDNTKPMYGEVAKNERYKKFDDEFTQNVLEQYGTIDSAVNLHIDHAWRYFYHNDLKTAMKRFNQAWLLNAAKPDAYFGFAALMDMQGDSLASQRFYQMGIDKDKAGERARICYQRIATCKEQLQDYKGTIEAYRKIIALDPGYAFAYEKIGYFQMGDGHTEEALIAYGKAIELNPKSATTYNNRAYLYQTQKRYKDAIADYSKAIELDATYMSAYVNRGVTAMEQKNYKAAKKDFEMAVQLDAHSGSLRRMLGLAKVSLKDTLGACKDFRLAKQLGDELADKLMEQTCK